MGKGEAFGFGLRLADFCKAEKKKSGNRGKESGRRGEGSGVLARAWEKEIKMFQVGEREREREPRSKQFYDTGRRRDITLRRFLRIGKAPEVLSSLSFPPVPTNYVSLLFVRPRS